MEALKKGSKNLVQENEQIQSKLLQSEMRLSSSREVCEQLKVELHDAAESYEAKIRRMESDRQSLLENFATQKKEISDLHQRLTSAKAEAEESKRDMCTMRRKQSEDA